MAGCNQPLWKSPLTQENLRVGEMGHIYSFSPRGPRGHKGVRGDALNTLGNLILVCPACHRLIDQDKEGVRFSAAELNGFKLLHERRIELATSVSPDKKSHVLQYSANIGDHSSPISFGDTAGALFPLRYPAETAPIDLSTTNSALQEKTETFWRSEQEQLVTKFADRVRDRLAVGQVSHVSVFGLAPQPLLILMGTLLTDIVAADVYQLHREPRGWSWPANGKVVPLEVKKPRSSTGTPALVLSLSATVRSDRIKAVLGPKVALWRVSIGKPSNDFVRSPDQLVAFRQQVRALLNRIKAQHGQTTSLHIFPAAPVSIAVELGRIRMPKADMPWRIYDQVNARGGFVSAINIQ